MMLVLHVVTGIGALVLGAALLRMDKRSPWHPRLGTLYHWVMLLATASALAVSALRGRATIFTYLAPPSYALALMGYLSAKKRWRNWLSWHISGQTGSYIALITATLFQIVPRFWQSSVRVLGLSLVFWVVFLTPGLLASPLIARTRRRWVKARKPAAFRPVLVSDSSVVNAA